MAKSKPGILDIEAKAAEILQRTWATSTDATAFITERVAFQMKNLIRACRKNYWGVFDDPIDPVTGRKKIWIPLTESAVEAIVKNIDLDTKDINLRAKKPQSYALTALIKSIVRNHLEANNFGELLDEALRCLAIDGTVVWKTTEKLDKHGKKTYDTRLVDLLNFGIDPTARSIAEADFVVERIIMTKDEFDAQKFPLNTENVATVTSVSRYDENLSPSTVPTATNYVEAYEGWGLIPKWLITGKEKDTDAIEGRIVATSNSNAGFTIHLIEKNTKKKRPYQEAWYNRIHGRWYGKGVAEKLIMLQLWINTIVNIRINRSYVSQLGLFKIRRGSGIAPQNVSKLASQGAILVDKQDDIEQFVMQEASQASYSDENIIKDWAERITNAFQIVTGEELPSSTPATNAVLLNRSAQSGFTIVKEGIGMFLTRWLGDDALPIIQKSITKQEIIRVSGDIDEIAVLDEQIVKYLAWKELDRMTSEGLLVDPQDVLIEIESAKAKLAAMGNDRYIEILQEIDLTEYDIQIYVTNEEFEKTVMVKDLLTALQAAPEYKDAILTQVFDIMGLNIPQLKNKTPLLNYQPQIQPGQQGQPGIPGQQVPQPQQAGTPQPSPSAQSDILNQLSGAGNVTNAATL